MEENREIRNKIIKDIETACEFCEQKFTHEELIEILKGDDDIKKQICILKVEKLCTQEEADLLVFHLTEHHGIVRESTAQKLHEIILNGKYINLFQNNYAYETFLKAVNDVNPNICRLIIACLPCVFEDNETGKDYFLNLLYERFEAVFEELEKLKRSTWYTKKLFNLYWCLETLGTINAPLKTRLLSVLKRTCAFRDYTIREKSAFVLSKIKGRNEEKESSPKDETLRELKESLKDDPNFYVRRYAEDF